MAVSIFGDGGITGLDSFSLSQDVLASVPTNGVYLSATNMVGIATNGTGRLFVSSAGLVGVGTSSPSEKLEVSLGNVAITYGHSLMALGGYVQRKYLWSSYTTQDTLNIGVPGSYGGYGSDETTARVTINQAGNVGIGTTSPDSYRLAVFAGNSANISQFDSTAANGGYAVFSTSSTMRGYVGAGGNTFASAAIGDFGIRSDSDLLFAAGGGYERARIDSSGRLLVGTSSARSIGTQVWAQQIERVSGVNAPTAGISITNNQNDIYGGYVTLAKTRGTSVGANTALLNGDILGAIQFAGADGSTVNSFGATIECRVDGTPGVGDMPGRLIFSTTADGASTSTERMRISSTGVLSVGTASAPNGVHNIQWKGPNRCDFTNMDTTATNAYGIGILYGGGVAPNGTGNEFLYCADNAAVRAKILSNGGIANYSANDVNLSDRNVKKDILLASSTWNCLKGWEVVNFRYKDQADDTDLSIGVIAQQVATNCPEVVTVFQEAKKATDDQPAQEERIGVKEQQMMWMAVKALQEAQLRIETLEADVAALKNE